MKYDNLKFGCEFEFYPNINLEDELIDALKDILKPKISLKQNLDENDDFNMNYKIEPSLYAMGGKEITTPICTYEELKEYIVSICKIIDNNGSTNEDTGFHIHISTDDEDLELDFYKFMLLCNEADLLENWGERNSYCLNVMKVLNTLDMEEAKVLKNKKGRVWNLEKRKEKGIINHVEIRTIGGTNYQTKVEQIFKELEQFIQIFNRSLKDGKKDDEYKIILQEHIKLVNSAPREKREKFLEIIA